MPPNNVYVDLTGKKIGRLTVVKLADIDDQPRRGKRWVCMCDCGTQTIVTSGSLIHETTKSCGCLSRSRYKKHKLDDETTNLGYVYAAYKSQAKLRNLEFSIPKDYAFPLFKSNCYYCGRPPMSEKKDLFGGNSLFYNGIDRVDNEIGYTIDNCVTCCILCNKAKGNLTLFEFKNWITQLYNNLLQRGNNAKIK